jgi:type VI secretion system protein ImpM
MVKSPARRVSWWGKLPARGDFIGRGLPPRWRNDWDDWLQRGLALAGAEVRDRLASFAPWRYLALPADGEMWCGILVASRDRVGRAFPLTLVERMATPASPRESAERLASLLDAAAQGPDALEAAIAAMPASSAAWFEPAQPWPGAPCSLWWPLAAADDDLPRIAHWPPKPQLLLELLDIQGGGKFGSASARDCAS